MWTIRTPKCPSATLKRPEYFLATTRTLQCFTSKLGHRGRHRRQSTKTSAVNHKEIDTHSVNRMPLRRPWRTEKKNPVLDKVWTSLFGKEVNFQALFSDWPNDYCVQREARSCDLRVERTFDGWLAMGVHCWWLSSPWPAADLHCQWVWWKRTQSGRGSWGNVWTNAKCPHQKSSISDSFLVLFRFFFFQRKQNRMHTGNTMAFLLNTLHSWWVHQWC